MISSRSHLRYVKLPGRASANPFEGAVVDALAMRLVRLEGGRRRSPHRHPHSQEAIFVVRGAGVLWEDGVAHRFEAGDCALIHTGVPHATIPDPGTSMELACFFPHPDLDANIEELEDMVLVHPDAKGKET
jgi:quercetin dioxygenase-like cupin family protein